MKLYFSKFKMEKTTMKRTVLLLTIGLGFGFLSANKTPMCHVPPMNDLLVEWAAIPAHLAHGDWIGTCAVPPCPSEFGCE